MGTPSGVGPTREGEHYGSASPPSKAMSRRGFFRGGLKTAATIAAAVEASHLANGLLHQAAHPLADLAINPLFPNETADVYTPGILDYSNITSREALGRLIPDGGDHPLLQYWITPWHNGIPPEARLLGEQMFSNGSNPEFGVPYAVVLVRDSYVDVWPQGQLVEVGAVSSFGNCGPSSSFPGREQTMIIMSPWSVAGDLRRIALDRYYDGNRSGVRIVARTDTLKGQRASILGQYLLPSCGVPGDTQTDASGQRIPSKLGQVIKVDGEPKQVMGSLEVISGKVRGTLVQFPYAGSMKIFNPLRDGFWDPSEMCLLMPHTSEDNRELWTTGTLKAHVNKSGQVVLPLYSGHSPELGQFLGVDPRTETADSAEKFFTHAADNDAQWKPLPCDDYDTDKYLDLLEDYKEVLFQWDYTNNWIVAKAMAHGNGLKGIDVAKLPGGAPVTPHRPRIGMKPYPYGVAPAASDAGARMDPALETFIRQTHWLGQQRVLPLNEQLYQEFARTVATQHLDPGLCA